MRQKGCCSTRSGAGGQGSGLGPRLHQHEGGWERNERVPKPIDVRESSAFMAEQHTQVESLMGRYWYEASLLLRHADVFSITNKVTWSLIQTWRIPLVDRGFIWVNCLFCQVSQNNKGATRQHCQSSTPRVYFFPITWAKSRDVTLLLNQ